MLKDAKNPQNPSLLQNSMQVIICGGALQGVELCFLAKEAAWSVVLFDKNIDCPARKMADVFIEYDLINLNTLQCDSEIAKIFKNAKLIIPATENKEALKSLVDYCKKNALCLAFDYEAYQISSSKLKSRDVFLQCKSPLPKPFFDVADISYPLLAKPSEESGSVGVQVFYDERSFLEKFPQGVKTPLWIFEAFCEGPSYSIEISGKNGNYKTYTITALHMDEVYDCSGVSSPSTLSEKDKKELELEAIKLAKILNLQGLMDLEIIMTHKGYVVLEIDARFPSQTPSVVYYASGINLIEELASVFIDEYVPCCQEHVETSVLYEHYLFTDGDLKNLGEHVIQKHGPLKKVFFEKKYPVLIGKTKNSLVATFILYADALQRYKDENERKEALKNFLQTEYL